jgi:hypothetical protein
LKLKHKACLGKSIVYAHFLNELWRKPAHHQITA